MSEDAVAADQTYRHYKGNLYLVLGIAVAVPRGGALNEGDKLIVSTVDGALRVTLVSDGLIGARLFSADWTGEPVRAGVNPGKLVVYVGCYDNPHGNRVCVRPLSEWTSEVEVGREGFMGGPTKMPRYRKLS